MMILGTGRPLYTELDNVKRMLTSSLPSTVRHITLEVARGHVARLSPFEDGRLAPTWADFERELTRRYPRLGCLEFVGTRISHGGRDSDVPSLELLVKQFFSDDFARRVKFRFVGE